MDIIIEFRAIYESLLYSYHYDQREERFKENYILLTEGKNPALLRFIWNEYKKPLENTNILGLINDVKKVIKYYEKVNNSYSQRIAAISRGIVFEFEEYIESIEKDTKPRAEIVAIILYYTIHTKEVNNGSLFSNIEEIRKQLKITNIKADTISERYKSISKYLENNEYLEKAEEILNNTYPLAYFQIIRDRKNN